MTKFKSCFAAFLCAALLFSGCIQSDGSDWSVPDIQGDASFLTGQFVQDEVPLPDGISSVIEIRELNDGKLLLVGANAAEVPVAYTTTDGKAWEEFAPSPNLARLEGASTVHRTHYNVDDAGVWWAATDSGEGGVSLFMLTPGAVREVPVSGGQAQGAFTTQIEANETHLLLCYLVGESYSWEIVDAKAGKSVATIASNGLPSGARLVGENVHVLMARNHQVRVYGLADGKEKETQSLPADISADLLLPFCFAGDKSLSYLDTDGLRRIAYGGNMIQNVFSNRSYAYAINGLSILDMVAAKDDSYWMAGTLRGTAHLYHYRYDENAPATTDNTLHVWAMDDGVLLREAAMVFSQNNPGCELAVEYGHTGDETGQTDEDIIRDINMRILAGDAPDVLILDGLPIRPMIENGLLEDLSGIVNEDEYYANILNAYTQDGQAFAYPCLFAPVVMMSKPNVNGELLAGIASMEELLPLLEDAGKFRFGGYKNVFTDLYDGMAPDIFPGGNSVNEEALRSFLSITSEIVAMQNLSSTELDPIYLDGTADHIGSSLSFSSPAVHIPVSIQSYGRETNATSAGVGKISSFWLISNMLNYAENGPEAELAPFPTKAFVPVCIASVTSGSENVEGAKDFVRTLLECQNPELSIMHLPGIMTRKGMDEEYRRLFAEKSNEEEPGSAIEPGMYGWDNLFVALETVSDGDLMLKAKLYEGAAQLYTGAMSLDECVAHVLQNTRLYFAERE